MYTVIVNGFAIQCETAAAAIDLARQAAADGAKASGAPARQAGPEGPGATSRWTEQRLREFFGLIKTPQRKLIDALYDAQDGRTSDWLLQHLGLGGGAALAGVFSGLYKNAEKAGGNPKDVYSKETVELADRRQYEYKLTESFRAAIRSHGRG